ncbi:wd-40 repeat protein [Cystoisospora suis]|uniref:Wd-40 repeat protein n=1 Tax=Cystoisospora suis TaxID=483139 RepID=A0A2C6KNW1_9APIC|nr:wd-40 repeat protein [Cystoisospora suis]
MARPRITPTLSSPLLEKTITGDRHVKSKKKKIQTLDGRRKEAKQERSHVDDRCTSGMLKQQDVKFSSPVEDNATASARKKQLNRQSKNPTDHAPCTGEETDPTCDGTSFPLKREEQRHGNIDTSRVEKGSDDIQRLEEFLFGKKRRRKIDEHKLETTLEDVKKSDSQEHRRRPRRKRMDFSGDGGAVSVMGDEQLNCQEAEDVSDSCEGVSLGNSGLKPPAVHRQHTDMLTSSEGDSRKMNQKREKLLQESSSASLSSREGKDERAWVDSDDEKLVVDLASQPKLRKLRQNRKEHRVSGVVFQERLKELHEKRMNNGESVDWVEKARQRKLCAHFEKIAEGYDSDPSLAEGLQAITRTGQSLAEVHSGRQEASSRMSRLGALTTADSRRQIKGFVGQGKLSVKRLENANKAERSGSAICALEFHPRMPLLFTGGRDKTLRIFSIDGQDNPKVESLHLVDYPILKAHFTQHDGGQHILAVSNANRSLLDYDLETGQTDKIPAIAGRRDERCFHFLEMGGRAVTSASSLITHQTFALASASSQDVLVCDARTKRLLSVLSMNAKVAGIAYHPARNSIFTADREAYVYEWDVRTGGCVDKFRDEACLRLSALAASPPACAAQEYHSSALLATGSRTGFVGLFSLSVVEPVARKPTKELGNLTTEITTLAFHPTNQLMCVASKWKKDAFRIVHVPSSTVYQNWPTERSPLRYVTAADFSPYRGFLAVGNDRGNALLYQLRHFA